MKKRILSTFLCLCMALTLLPMAAGAMEASDPVANLSWEENGEAKTCGLSADELCAYYRDKLNSSVSTATLTLLSDVALKNYLSLRTAPITLNGGGHTLTRDGGYGFSMLRSHPNLSNTMENVTIDGTYCGKESSSNPPAAVEVMEESNLTVKNASIINGGQPPATPAAEKPIPVYAGGVKVDAGGTLRLEDGAKITNCIGQWVGGVYAEVGSQVILSGNVQITGNTAGDRPFNLSLQTTKSGENVFKPIQITGSLAGSSVGIYINGSGAKSTLPFKVAVGAEGYTPTKDDAAAFVSDEQGYVLDWNEADNAIYLDAYAITQQPTQGNSYEVKANGAPSGYQWYPAKKFDKTVVGGTNEDTDTTAAAGTQWGEYSDLTQRWTANNDGKYFDIDLKAGDKVTVTLATADVPDPECYAILGLACFDEDENIIDEVWYDFSDPDYNKPYASAVVDDGGNTVITYVIPADGDYDLLFGGSDSAPAVSATLTRTVLDTAVSGQTGKTLTAATAGTYLCRVTWPDGFTMNSNVVDYIPPHKHDGDNTEFKKELTVNADGDLLAGGKSTTYDINGAYHFSLPVPGDTTGPFTYYLGGTDDRLAPASGRSLEIKGDVRLCLNGKTLERGVATVVEGGAKLTIYDCGDTGALTSDGQVFTVDIDDESSGELILESGRIIDVPDEEWDFNGAAICQNGGYITLKGGTVEGPYAVAVSYAAGSTDPRSPLTLTGAPTLICENTKAHILVQNWDIGDPGEPGGGSSGEATPPIDAVGYTGTAAVTIALRTRDLANVLGQPIVKVSAANADKFKLVGNDDYCLAAKTVGDVTTLLLSKRITEQPSKSNNYTVTAPGASGYQWYTTKEVPKKVIASYATAGDDTVEASDLPGDYDEPTDRWTANNNGEYFSIDLKAGDKLTVSFPESAMPDSGGLYLTEVGGAGNSWSHALGNSSHNGFTVTDTTISRTFTVGGTFTLKISGLNNGAAAPAISATLTRLEPDQPVSGQTTKQFTAATAGTYLCRVTWPDGITVDSNVVSIPHRHAMSVGCETEEENVTPVTFKALTVNDQGELCVDGEALTPDDQYGNYTLPAGNYYLAQNITMDSTINIRDSAGAPTNLCLNGHTLDLVNRHIKVESKTDGSKGVLNLCDCGATGKITSAHSGAYANAATIEVSHQFFLYGGTVENTNAGSGKNKSAVGFNGGDLSLYGGKLVSRGNGLWVNCWQTDSLHLSGDVSIQGGTDQADICFDSPNAQHHTHFTLTGPLSKPAAPWRVAVDHGMPMASGWAQYMSSEDFNEYFKSVTKGLLIEKNNAGDLLLSACDITQQPTAENKYTVTANGAAPYAPTYQWYPAAVTTKTVGTADSDTTVAATATDATYAGGTWTVNGGTMPMVSYFNIDLVRGDKVTVTLPTADVPTHGQLGLTCYVSGQGYIGQVWYAFGGSYVSEGVTAAPDGEGNTVITYVIPADGTYGLQLDGLFDAAAPAISATLTHTVLGTAVTGQNNNKLSTIGLASGTYLCKVTWPDGTKINSDLVEYVSSFVPVTPDAPVQLPDDGGTVSKDPDSGNVTITPQGGESAAITVTPPENGEVMVDTTTGLVTAPEGSVVTQADGTKTTITENTGAIMGGTVTLPNGGKATTEAPDGTVSQLTATTGGIVGEVVVKPATPAVTTSHGELQGLAGTKPAGAETVTVTLTVEKQETPADKAALEGAIQGKKDDVLYLDLSLRKTTVQENATPTQETITDTGATVLEIVIPYDFTGKKDVTAYRKHGSEPAQALTKLNARPAAGTYQDGCFFADSANGKVYIYASKFSTYAIGYSVETVTPPSGSDDDDDDDGHGGGAAATPGSKPTTPTGGKPSDSAPAAVDKFTDVKPTDWFYDGVAAMVEQGLMEGTGKTTFAPETITTRSMIVTILYRMAGQPEMPEANWGYPYADVDAKAYYGTAVYWARLNEVAKGYSAEGFGPDDPITREQLAVMLWRYAKAEKSGGDLSAFSDAGSVSPWALDAVTWAVDKGIITGRGGGILDPQAHATRAEAAAMLDRYIQTEK